MQPSRDWMLYAGSAAAAAAVRVLSSTPIHRDWASAATLTYVAAAAAAFVFRRRQSLRLRATLAVLVFAGSSVVPLALEVGRRADTTASLHAQSEVIVTEEAAKVLLAGKDPYERDYGRGPLRERSRGTQTHFPYLPLMLAFGLPRAVLGGNPFTDARIWFAAAFMVLGWLAVSLAPTSPRGRMEAAQAIFVLPTTAVLMATGGDDLPVIALMLLGGALAEKGWSVRAGVALGLAAAMKQTAWPLLLFLMVTALRASFSPSARDRGGDGGPDRFGFVPASVGMALVVVIPFVLWNPSAFLEDTVLFPLGLGSHSSPARAPTIGRALVDAFPSARIAITVAIGAIVLIAGGVLLARTAPAARAAARSTALLLLLAVALAPVGRIGYLVYPVSLLGWAWAEREADPAARSVMHRVR